MNLLYRWIIWLADFFLHHRPDRSADDRSTLGFLRETREMLSVSPRWQEIGFNIYGVTVLGFKSFTDNCLELSFVKDGKVNVSRCYAGQTLYFPRGASKALMALGLSDTVEVMWHTDIAVKCEPPPFNRNRVAPLFAATSYEMSGGLDTALSTVTLVSDTRADHFFSVKAMAGGTGSAGFVASFQHVSSEDEVLWQMHLTSFNGEPVSLEIPSIFVDPGDIFRFTLAGTAGETVDVFIHCQHIGNTAPPNQW